MKKNLDQQEKDLEEKIRAFESERDAWDEQNKPADEQWVTNISYSIIRLAQTRYNYTQQMQAIFTLVLKFLLKSMFYLILFIFVVCRLSCHSCLLIVY